MTRDRLVLVLVLVACGSEERAKPPPGPGSVASPAIVADALAVPTMDAQAAPIDAMTGARAARVPCPGTRDGCLPGQACVATRQVGGAPIRATPRGCPPGSRVERGRPFCQPIPSYACRALPEACDGKPTCACARSLCPDGHHCSVADEALFCERQVP
jgi:hypothetical protein